MIFTIILWIYTIILWILLTLGHFKNNDTAKTLLVIQVLVITPIVAFIGLIFGEWIIGITYFVLWGLLITMHYFHKKKQRKAKQDIRDLYREIGQEYSEDD